MYKQYSDRDILEMLINACFDLVHNPTKRKTQKRLDELEQEVLERMEQND